MEARYPSIVGKGGFTQAAGEPARTRGSGLVAARGAFWWLAAVVVWPVTGCLAAIHQSEVEQRTQQVRVAEARESSVAAQVEALARERVAVRTRLPPVRFASRHGE